jgi:hypothetical protein
MRIKWVEEAFILEEISVCKDDFLAPLVLNPILNMWFRYSCFTRDGSSTTQVFPLLFHNKNLKKNVFELDLNFT